MAEFPYKSPSRVKSQLAENREESNQGGGGLSPRLIRGIGPYEAKLFAFGLVLCLVARGPSLLSLPFNVDDLFYWRTNFDFDALTVVAFREGRFFGPFVAELLSALGVNASLTFTLSAFALMVCQSITAILLCRLWQIDRDWRLSAVVISLLLLHPYQADLSTWKIAQFPGGLPFVMVFWALLICTRNTMAFIGAVILIVLGLGIHQIPLEMAAAALALQVPLALVRGNFDPKSWFKRVLALAIGTVAYVVIAKLVISLSSHEGTIGRDNLIIFSDPALVMDRAWELLSMMVLEDPLTGWLSRALIAGIAALCVVRIALARMSLARKGLIILSLAGALIIAYLCAISLTVVPEAWMPVFRNMLSVGVIWAAVAAIAYAICGLWGRRVVVTLLVLILVGLTGSNNRVLTDQQRVNQRDIAMMNRIAADIGALEHAKLLQRILFVGTSTKSLTGIPTAADLSSGWHAYGTSLSVFAVPWPGYLVQLYNEVTGSRLGFLAMPDEVAMAGTLCGQRRWPEKISIYQRGTLAIVCLGTPTELTKGPFDYRGPRSGS